jgi:hypothetical protein
LTRRAAWSPVDAQAYAAERAAAALRAVGFADRTIRVFSGERILDDHARHTAQRPSASADL